MNWTKGAKTLLLLSGWIVSVFLGVLELPQKFHSFFENYPKAKSETVDWWNLNTEFTGSWTNEGDVVAPSDRKLVAVRMRTYNGRVDGEIWSESLSDTIHPVILLGGNVNHSRLDAYAFDYIEGKEAVFARLTIKKAGDDLILTTIDQAADFFPKETRLFPNPDALEGKPLINFELIEKILKQQTSKR